MRRAAISGLLLLGLAAACVDRSRDDPSRDRLRDAWESYKRIYITAGGNVIDRDRGGGLTTSEGQGYAMLRAAWMRDAATFKLTFEWTERHLKRPDGLYSWLWSPEGGVVDANTAADADQEIAFALVIASNAFGDPGLLVRARELLQAIRRHERVDVNAGWFPAAGNWGAAGRIVNLSYFVPYAYPYFARVDPEGKWETVTDTGYDLLYRTLQMPSTRIIPDFMVVTTEGQPAPLAQGTGLSSVFSSDSLRIYWRVAVDCRLHKRTRACADPLGAAQLTSMLARDGALFTKYALDGTPIERVESSSFYGAALPYLLIHAPAAADAVRRSRLSDAVLRPVLTGQNRYFDANWVWFGLAAADGLIASRTPAVAAISIDSARP